jgi:hypothetical protein
MPGRRERHTHLRNHIASAAARIMAEDGIADYVTAKKKAARQLGVPDTEALPNNAEVETELRIYQSLYQNEELNDRVSELRQKAYQLMQMLPQFHPYLTGSVLDGTAGRFAEIDILLFADSAKEVEIFLLNRKLDYNHVTPRHERAEAVLQVAVDDAIANLVIYPVYDERVVFRHRDGRIRERAKTEAVAALIAAHV